MRLNTAHDLLKENVVVQNGAFYVHTPMAMSIITVLVVVVANYRNYSIVPFYISSFTEY